MSRMTVNERNQFDRAGYNDATPRMSAAGRRALILTTLVGLAILAVLSVAALQVFDGGHHWIVLADLVVVVLGLAAWVNPERRNV